MITPPGLFLLQVFVLFEVKVKVIALTMFHDGAEAGKEAVEKEEEEEEEEKKKKDEEKGEENEEEW